MITAQSQTETYVSLNRIATNTGINSRLLQYHAQKQGLRYIKYNGVRRIEVNCAIALLEWLSERKCVKAKNLDVSAEVARLKSIRARFDLPPR